MKSILLRASLFFFLSFLLKTSLLSQRVKMIQASYFGDSSYYDVAKIAPGRYWMAGENGLLNEIDSTGNIRKLAFPGHRVNILCIQAYKENVYVGTDQGGLFKFDQATQSWSKALVPKKFQKRCFYDMKVLPGQNKLLLSGGHQKIAKGKKTLPLGFIASIDLEFQEVLSVLYKNAGSFIWALELSGSQVYAASFGGVQTKILKDSGADLIFKKQSYIPGLVHHLEAFEGAIYYSGTATTKYAQHGVTGKIGGLQQKHEGYGCIWSIKKVGDQWVGLDYSGDILLLDNQLGLTERIEISNHSLYELEILSNTHALVVGHGCKIASIDLSYEFAGFSAKK